MSAQQIFTLTLFFLLLAGICRGEEPNQVAAWVEGLQADEFAVREWATNRLIEAGPASVEPLIARMSNFEMESTVRGLAVLHTLALREDETAELAEDAVRRLANKGATATSQRAQEALRSIVADKPARAERILRRLGADFDSVASTYSSLVTISFNDSWHGTVKDLAYLQWLTDYRDIFIKASGANVNDQWLELLSGVPNVVGLNLSRAKVTDSGLRSIKEMPQLRELRVLYCDVSNACLQHLDPGVSTELQRVFAFGTKIEEEAFDTMTKRMKAKQPQFIGRFGLGGFLGIAGRANPNGKGCEVTDVTPNEAASRAGILPDDIILEYAGHPVNQFSPPDQQPPGYAIGPQPPVPDLEGGGLSLSQLIGKNRPGENVTLKILRKGTYLTKEVELGEWP